MKLGVSFFTFDEQVDVHEAMQQCKKAGYRGVDLIISDTGALNTGATEKEILAIRKMADELDLAIPSIGSNNVWNNNLASPNPDEHTRAIDNIKRQIDVAQICGADLALVVPGWVGTPFVSGTVPYDVAYDNAQKGLAAVEGYARAAGVSIGIENVWNKFLLSPLEMRRFLDEIGSPYIGAYFDIGNIIYVGYPEQWIRILDKHIKRLQFCDCRFEQSGLGMFVDLFEGDVDFAEVMCAIRDIGYDGWAVVEFFPNYRRFPYQSIINARLSMQTILDLA